jgi:hypothetical protein
MIQVNLTPQEMVIAAMIGAQRHAESVASGRRDAHGFDPKAKSGLSIHVEGACGELAVAKCRDIFWGGALNSFKAADLGVRVQVRTRLEHSHQLIVRRDDADDHAFIHVTGTAPNFRVKGWMWGREAKQPEYLATHGNREEAYFVPDNALRPMKKREP